MRGKLLQEMYELAESFEKVMFENGLPPFVKDGVAQQRYMVLIHHEEGTQFVYYNAFCFVYGEWLMIFPEHHDNVVLHIDDLTGYTLAKTEDVPFANFANNKLNLEKKPKNGK